jgi:alpha-N-arabinofuranosidase
VEVAVNLLGGASAARSRGRVLTGEIHAHNTFDQPQAIGPKPFSAGAIGSQFTLTLPAASVVAIEIDLV